MGPAVPSPAPARPDPLKPLADALADVVLGAVPQAAWVTQPGGGVFFLSRDGGPAHQFGAQLAYPPAAREAALGGRAVTVAAVWTVRDGALARVFVRPIELRPMVCEFDAGCDLVKMPATATEPGRVEIGSGTCPVALANLDAHRQAPTTFDAFDRAVVPAMCKGAGTYAWNGTAFTVVASGPSRMPEGLPPGKRSAPPVPSPRRKATDEVTATARIDGDTAVASIVEAMFPGSIQSTIEANVAMPDGSRRLAFRATYPAPSHAFFTHHAETREWESGWSFEVTEVWSARRGDFRRVFRVPTGLAALAEPHAVARLTVELGEDGSVVVGGAPAPCRADPARRDRPADLTAVEAALRDRDEQAAARICSAQGRYEDRGHGFARVEARGGKSAP